VSLQSASRNLLPVIAGNVVGGSVLVALAYWLIYRRAMRPTGSAPQAL
jgi:formate/nitrite transporter FocA (FNT family)